MHLCFVLDNLHVGLPGIFYVKEIFLVLKGLSFGLEQHSSAEPISSYEMIYCMEKQLPCAHRVHRPQHSLQTLAFPWGRLALCPSPFGHAELPFTIGRNGTALGVSE